MKDPKMFLFVFGLFIQTCLAENVETTKHGHNTDASDKKVSKRDYYAPEYNHDHYSYPAYRFEYGVHDPQTGDIKKQYEERDGDTVRGYYSLVEPDGSIRLVEYTADSKNGFQATVKKIGSSHHPTTVTHHLNTANAHHGGDGGYAPNYHGGDRDFNNHHLQQPSLPTVHDGHQYEPPAYSNHYEPPQPPAYNDHYEPPVHGYDNHQYQHQQQQLPVPGYDNHQYHHQQQQLPPSAYNHYEPPLVPAVHNHFQHPPSPVAAYDHYEPPLQVVVPAGHGDHHFEPPAAHPEPADFEHGSPLPPLFAAGLPTAHGDYGSASPEEYYPAPLQFPVTSHETHFEWPAKSGSNDDGDGLSDGDPHHRGHLQDEYQFPASKEHSHLQGAAAKVASGERPEYLRKYFEPNYRGHAAAVNSFYDDDE